MKTKQHNNTSVTLARPSERSEGIQHAIRLDEAWFAKRPGRNFRCRFTTEAELADARERDETRFAAMMAGCVAVITVVVRLGADGRQARLMRGVSELSRDPKSFSEEECHDLADHLVHMALSGV